MKRRVVQLTQGRSLTSRFEIPPLLIIGQILQKLVAPVVDIVQRCADLVGRQNIGNCQVTRGPKFFDLQI